MLWRPHPNKEYVLYILSGMWGITDGLWQTHTTGRPSDISIIFTSNWKTSGK